MRPMVYVGTERLINHTINIFTEHGDCGRELWLEVFSFFIYLINIYQKFGIAKYLLRYD